MTAPAVADEVDNHVAMELLAECEREFGNSNDSFGVVSIDMEDRGLDGLGDICGVRRRVAFTGRGGEPNLVVDVHVDGSAGAVRAQLRHLQDLDHDALS